MRERRVTYCSITRVSIWMPSVSNGNDNDDVEVFSSAIETSRHKSESFTARFLATLHFHDKRRKLKSLLRFKRSCKTQQLHVKGHKTVVAHKEWKLFKCRLRNVHTIYQDFHTEIIIMSIYEVFLLSPHFSPFSFVRILETAAEKERPKVNGGRKDMRWKKLSSFRLFLMVSHSYIHRYLGQRQKKPIFEDSAAFETLCCCLLMWGRIHENDPQKRKMRQI